MNLETLASISKFWRLASYFLTMKAAIFIKPVRWVEKSPEFNGVGILLTLRIMQMSIKFTLNTIWNNMGN